MGKFLFSVGVALLFGISSMSFTVESNIPDSPIPYDCADWVVDMVEYYEEDVTEPGGVTYFQCMYDCCMSGQAQEGCDCQD